MRDKAATHAAQGLETASRQHVDTELGLRQRGGRRSEGARRK